MASWVFAPEGSPSAKFKHGLTAVTKGHCGLGFCVYFLGFLFEFMAFSKTLIICFQM
jgi:hypothetical protein